MLIEREYALERLSFLARRAASGNGAIALISGEAGIGKTSLLREFKSTRHAEFQLTWGGCDALSTPRALGPLHDMGPDLSPCVQNVLRKDTSLSNLLPAVIKHLSDSDQTVVMVFEDVHWADNATLDLLKCLGRRISLLKTLLILSYRVDEIGPRHPMTNLLGELPQANTQRIELNPISPEGTNEIASQWDRTIANLHEITNGNPFYMTELLAADAGEQDKVPLSIQDAIGSRLNRLPVAEQQFLETLSVIPHAIERQLVNHLYPDDGDTLADECIQRKLLQEDLNGNLRFRHELARLGTKERTTGLMQKVTHRRIVEVLSGNANDQTIDQILYHACAAKISDVVLQYAPLAAKAASISGAHSEAASHLEVALQYINDAPPETAATLYEKWSYEAALVHIDDDVIAARHSALELWRKLDRADKVGENLRWLSRLHWYHGHADKANQFADEAISIFESTSASSEQAMAYSMKSQFYMLNDRMEEAILWGKKALDIEAQCNNDEVKIHALNNMGSAMALGGDQTGLEHLNKSLNLALKKGYHEHAARAYTNTADYAVSVRNFDLAEKTINDGIVFDSKHDLDSWTHYLVGLLAQLRMKQGRIEEAETISQGVLKMDKLTLLMKLPALLVLARVQSRLGRAEADTTLQASLNDALSTGEAQYILPARLGIIEHAWLNDQHDKAIAQIDTVLSSDLPVTGTWRDSEITLWMHRYHIRHPRVDNSRLPEPYQLEIKGDHVAAATAWRSIGSPYPAALALLNSPNGKTKLSHMKTAIELLDQMVATGTVRKAASLAETIGLKDALSLHRRGPRKPARQHPLGLTKKEQEILPWLINGLSNKEISEKFVRSERTIENHVASIYKKLNVHSRMEAMLRAKNEPWLVTDSDSVTQDQLSHLSLQNIELTAV